MRRSGEPLAGSEQIDQHAYQSKLDEFGYHAGREERQQPENDLTAVEGVSNLS